MCCCSVLKTGNYTRFLLVWILLTSCPSFLSSQVVINEMMAWNTTVLMDPDYGQSGDWVELINTGTTPAVLAGFYLSDNPDNTDKWQFPQGVQIPAGGFLLVWADGFDSQGKALHTGFKLDVGGEFIGLYDPAGLPVDTIRFPRQFLNHSYGRNAGNEWVYFSQSSPGSPNNTASEYRIAHGILFSPAPGIYPGNQSVSLTTTIPSASIRYTTDGSEPSQSSTLYTAPVVISQSTVIRAKVFADGYQPGWTETASYIIGFTSTLPILSISTTPANLWDNQIGIYVTGTNGITGYCSDVPRNYNQDWERPASIEYITPAGKKEFNADGGIKIFGGCSRGSPMKSLAFYCRNEYGYDEIRYPLFREKPGVDKFKDIVLRNSGNDFPFTMIRDAVMQAVVKGQMDIDAMAYEPVIIFLNGEYWGIHNLREKINEHWVVSNYDIPADRVDFIENYNQVMSGSLTHYTQLMSYMDSHDLSNPEYYNNVASRMDVDEYINYVITEFFFANTDWPGNNVKYWRPQTPDGRWRWIIFDLDFGLGLYDHSPSQDMFTFTSATNGPEWPNPPWSTKLFRNLLENPLFREKLVQRYSMHLNTTFRPARIHAVIDSLKAGIEPEFQRHINRWGEPTDMDSWNYHVSVMTNWVNSRIPAEWQNIASFFGLGGLYDVMVGPSDSLTGMIRLNTHTIPCAGFSGQFPGNSKLLLEPLPAPGYQVKEWKIERIQLNNSSLISRYSVWKYNAQGVYPGDGWKEPSFDDGAWSEGPAELGYGDGGEKTEISYGPDPEQRYITYYFRKSLTIPNPSAFKKYVIELLRDDGAVVYVNGHEVLRVLMPAGTVTMQTTASNYVGGTDESTYFTYDIPGDYFTAGTNVVAVEIHQSSPTSSDVSFDLALTAASPQVIGSTTYPSSTLSLPVSYPMQITASFEPRVDRPQLFINEFMASNSLSKQDEYGEFDDWIEVYNASPDPVNIAGYYITDNFDNRLKWKIVDGYPEKTTIQGKGYLILWADDAGTTQGPLHTNFKLAKEGEEIGIGGYINNTFYWFDTLSYSLQATDVSWGRYPDGGPALYSMNHYTPGAPNTLTAVEEPSSQDGLTIYPNPTSGLLNIRIDASLTGDGQAFIDLMDISGKTLYSLTETPGQSILRLDLTGLPPGIYFIRLKINDRIFHQKLIRQ